MRSQNRQQFDQIFVEEIVQEFSRHDTIGHVGILCTDPDFIRYLPYAAKRELASRYEDSYNPDVLTADSIDHANAHFALELQRGAFLLSSFMLQQLRSRQRDDLLAVVHGSHQASLRDTDFSRLDFAHRLVQASPPTHADAPAPLLPPH